MIRRLFLEQKLWFVDWCVLNGIQKTTNLDLTAYKMAAHTLDIYKFAISILKEEQLFKCSFFKNEIEEKLNLQKNPKNVIYSVKKPKNLLFCKKTRKCKFFVFAPLLTQSFVEILINKNCF